VRAVELIYDHDLSRGLRQIEGNGCARMDDPIIRAQMVEKHPTPKTLAPWPTLPPGWINTAQADIDLSALKHVLAETDPNVGVGPRGLRPDYLSALDTGRLSHPEAKDAKSNLELLGIKYLSFGLPPWPRRKLGGGLLTPLNKAAPVAGTPPDARPVKAEDSDTSAFCKTIARSTATPVKEAVSPQQLGIGVSSGIELFTLGLKLVLEEATRKAEDLVIVELDISNAHNDFPRHIALQKIITAALADPRLRSSSFTSHML
jgi:hypothetical protein